MPNPSFEPKTHRCRPGAGAPSQEVPSQICAICAPKQPFFARSSPQTRAKRPNEGKRWLHPTGGLTLLCQRALYCPPTPRYVRETAQKGAKKPQNMRHVHQQPETKNRPYLGLRGSKPNLFFFDVLQIFVMDPPRRPGAAGGTVKPWPGGSRGLPGPRPPRHLEWLPAAAAPAGAAAAAGGHSMEPALPTTPPIKARCVRATCVRSVNTVFCGVSCVV